MRGISRNRDFEATFLLSRAENPPRALAAPRGLVGEGWEEVSAGRWRSPVPRQRIPGRSLSADPRRWALPSLQRDSALPGGQWLCLYLGRGAPKPLGIFSELREKAGPGLGGGEGKCRGKDYILTPR